jgi:NitT/TauT family transport system permease protein/sulfonate transport system permease protein
MKNENLRGRISFFGALAPKPTHRSPDADDFTDPANRVSSTCFEGNPKMRRFTEPRKKRRPETTSATLKKVPDFTNHGIGIFAFFGIWQALCSLGAVDPFMLPAPFDVIKALWGMALDGSLWVNLLDSLKRVGMGYFFAALVGLPLGILCGWSKKVSDIIRPVIEALRPIPPLAWIPIAILWFGLGDASGYFLVFLGCIFPMFFGAYTAIRGLEPNLINAARCLGAQRWFLVWNVLIPASLPIIMPNLRLALGIGWMCVVTAELVAAQTGLGYLIQQSRALFQIQNVVAGMFAIGIVGYCMSALVEAIERRLTTWSPSQRS